MAIWPWRFFLKWALTYIYYIYGQHIGPTLLCCACRKTIICIFFCLENFPNIQLWKYTPAASWRKNEKNSNYIFRSVLNLHLCGALIDIKIRPCDTDHHPLSKGTTFLFSLSQTNYILKDFPTLSDMSLFWIRSELKVAPFKTMWAGWSSCQTTSTAVLKNKT